MCFTHGARPTDACKGCLKGHPKHMHPARSGTGLCPPRRQGAWLPGVAPHPCSQPAFGHAVGRATGPWLSCAGRRHMDGWRNAHPRQERPCTSPDKQRWCHPSCPAPCLGGLTLQSHRHTHPTAAGLGETLHWGNRDPHHIPELPDTPAEAQRCRSCPKGPRAPKYKLRPHHQHWAPPTEQEAPGSPSASPSHSEGQWQWHLDAGSTAEPDAPRAALGTAAAWPWLPQAALAHSGSGPGPGGTNKVTEEIEVSQRGREEGPQSPSPTPRAQLASPPGLWKGTGRASVTLSPHVPNPIPSMPLMILKQRVVNQ